MNVKECNVFIVVTAYLVKHNDVVYSNVITEALRVLLLLPRLGYGASR